MDVNALFMQEELKMRNVTKQSEAVPDLCDGGDPCHPHATARRGGVPFESIDDYRCAVQALCDVRHMLPPDGVAIVDAVLDRKSCGAALLKCAGNQEVGSTVLELFEYDSEQLNAEQASSRSERIFLNWPN